MCKDVSIVYYLYLQEQLKNENRVLSAAISLMKLAENIIILAARLDRPLCSPRG